MAPLDRIEMTWTRGISVSMGLRIISQVILASFLIRRLVAMLYRRRLAKQLHCRATGPRYPTKDHLFGLDYMYENGRNIMNYKFAEGVRQRFNKYGSTYFARMGFQRIVHTIDPLNLETIMKTRFDDYVVLPDRSLLVSVLLGDGVFTYNGDEWKKSRSLVHWGMGNLNIDTNILERHSSLLIDALRTNSIADPYKPVDFGEAATSYTFNVAAGLTFGDLTDDLPNETSQFAIDWANVSTIGQNLTLFIFMHIHWLFWSRIAPAQNRLFNIVDKAIQRALSNPKKSGRKHNSIIEGLATQTTDIQRIRGEALNLFLAGHDTVKIAFTEQIWHLARCPTAWEALRAEVAQLDGQTPTLSQLREMSYLNSIIKEAARLNPTLSVHGRKAIKNTVLPHGGGRDGLEPLLIPKGTYIAYSNYSLHRNPPVFGEDVDVFRPERWEQISPGKFEYLGFGAGPRFCPGKEVGWAIVAYATVRLAQEFEVLEGDGEMWQEARSFSFYNGRGCLVFVGDGEKGNGEEEEVV